MDQGRLQAGDDLLVLLLIVQLQDPFADKAGSRAMFGEESPPDLGGCPGFEIR